MKRGKLQQVTMTRKKTKKVVMKKISMMRRGKYLRCLHLKDAFKGLNQEKRLTEEARETRKSKRSAGKDIDSIYY